MAEKTKEQRIKREKTRLNKIFKEIEAGKREVVQGLIERAAFMRVELEDLERDIVSNGWVAPFQQSEKVDAYMRARPEGQTYTNLNSGYQKIVKQLVDIMPEDSDKNAAQELMNFVNRK